ncbi:MAG: hypothetical protein R3217_09220, partial [Gammaproteobacteria bacterium]|nr:hypothetical protein [Gammaproteobacteria bacterium]
MEIIEEGPKPARAWSLAIKTWHSRFWLARRIAALPEVEVVRMPNGRSFFTGKAFMEFDYKGVRYLAYKDKVSDEDFEIHP